VNESEIAERALALPNRFADRLEPNDLVTVREYADAGEWSEEIDLLLACLNETHQPVTAGRIAVPSRHYRR
jgi:hypothetical protein